MEQAGQGVGRATDSRPTKEEEEGTEHHPRDREATERPLPTRAVAMARQAAAIRAGALFVTTQTDIAFMMGAAAQWTRGVQEALATMPGTTA